MKNLNFKDIVESKTFKGFIFGILAFLILLIVFQAGIDVGFKKAGFSQRLGENYGRIFGDEKRPPIIGGMFEGMPFDNLPGSHGAAGIVIKLSSSTIIVAEPNNIEKIVLISDKTIIRKFRDQISIGNISVGDFVSVIGDANNDGDIAAAFIRVLPPAQMASSTINK